MDEDNSKISIGIAPNGDEEEDQLSLLLSPEEAALGMASWDLVKGLIVHVVRVKSNRDSEKTQIRSLHLYCDDCRKTVQPDSTITSTDPCTCQQKPMEMDSDASNDIAIDSDIEEQSSCLENLEELRLCHFGGPDNPLTSSATLQHCCSRNLKRLKRLVLEDCCLLLSSLNASFFPMLSQCQGLQELSLCRVSCCAGPRNETTNRGIRNICYSELWQQLTSLPDLRRLCLINSLKLPGDHLIMNNDTLQQCLIHHSPHLQELRLHNFQIGGDRELSTIIKSIVSTSANSQCCVLETLDLDTVCDLNDTGQQALLYLLQHDLALKTLKLKLRWSLNGNRENNNRKNKDQSLDLFFLQVASVLQHNLSALQHLEVLGYDLNELTEQAFVNKLKYNYRLQQVRYSPTWRTLPRVLEFALRLNQHGRARICLSGRMQQQIALHKSNSNSNSSDPQQQWIQVLAHCQDDVDCIYYFLQWNPTLLHCVGSIEDG